MGKLTPQSVICIMRCSTEGSDHCNTGKLLGKVSGRQLMNNKRKKEQAGTVSLHLSKREYQLIVDDVFHEARISKNLIRKMCFGVVTDMGLAFRLTPDELAELATNILFAADRAGNRSVRKSLETICRTIEKLLDVQTTEVIQEDLSDALPSSLPPDLKKLIQEMIKDREFDSIDEINEYLTGIMKEYNREPAPDMGGLSPSEVSKLVYSDWEDERSAITFNRNLSLAELKKARIFQNARTLLQNVLESNGVKATDRGNLNRKFVLNMVDAMEWPPEYVDNLWRYNKVLNEADVTPLHVLRVILELAGLLRFAKEVFKITNKGTILLEESNAGELYTLLFTTHFRKFNLSCLDRMPECPALQDTIAFSFYMLGRHGKQWKKETALAPLLLLPVAKTQMSRSDMHFGESELSWPAFSRILRPLESFGLLERWEYKKGMLLDNVKARKTGLFDRFIKFDLADR